MKRKEAAKKALFDKLAEDNPPSDPTKKKKYEEILSILKDNDYLLSTCEYTDRMLEDVLTKINEYISPGEHDFSSCRMLAYLAINRLHYDLNYITIDAIDRCISNLGKDNDKLGEVYIFKGIVLYAFNRIEEAIQAVQTASSISMKTGNKIQEMNAKSNLAYFLTEIAGNTDLEVRYNAPEMALTFINESIAIWEEQKKAAQASGAYRKKSKSFKRAERYNKDTLGAVLISFGRTENEVYEGCRLCCEIAEKDKDNLEMHLYCRMHQRKAFRRLLHFE